MIGPDRPARGEIGSRIISFGPDVAEKKVPIEVTDGQPPADPELP
jgi:hypothetical protein